MEDVSVDQLESSLDWRDHNVVSPVKDQSYCGSCYIFSAVAAMESAYMLASDGTNVYQFSEQAYLNCNNYVDDACQGGMIEMAWQIAMEKGIISQDDGPEYVAADKHCKQYQNIGKLSGYCISYKISNDDELRSVVWKYGPASVAIDASNEDFKYLRGEWNEDCGVDINHAMMIVGWNSDYYIIKNSWGTDWGIDGYLYLQRDGNKCGIFYAAGVPFVDELSLPKSSTVQESDYDYNEEDNDNNNYYIKEDSNNNYYIEESNDNNYDYINQDNSNNYYE